MNARNALIRAGFALVAALVLVSMSSAQPSPHRPALVATLEVDTTSITPAGSVDDEVNRTVGMIRARLVQYGRGRVEISRHGTRIELRLTGTADERLFRRLLESTGRFAFTLVRNDRQTAGFFGLIDRLLSGRLTRDDTAAAGTRGAGKGRRRGATRKQTPLADPYAHLSDDEARARYRSDHPFTSLFATRWTAASGGSPEYVAYPDGVEMPSGEYHFNARDSDRQRIEAILRRPDVMALAPPDLVVAFGTQTLTVTDEDTGIRTTLVPMYGLSRVPALVPTVVTDAVPTFGNAGLPAVLVELREDAARLASITRQHVGARVAIVIDTAVVVDAVIVEPILDGRLQIEPLESAAEAELLAILLRIGPLPAPVRVLELRSVD